MLEIEGENLFRSVCKVRGQISEKIISFYEPYVSELTDYFISGRKILERSSFLLPTTKNSK